MQRRKLFLAAGALASAVALSACGRSGMRISELPRHEVNASAAEVRAAIHDYVRGHGFQIEREDARSITMRYPSAASSRGSTFARYRVEYGEGYYRIVFLESQGMSEDKDEYRGRTGHRKIDQWQRQMDRGIASLIMKNKGRK